MRNLNRKIEYIECNCIEHSHSIRVMWWEEPPGVVEDGILYIDFIVNRKLPFFKRLILIVKYIFNIDDFSISEEILLHDQEAKKLRDILNKIC